MAEQEKQPLASPEEHAQMAQEQRNWAASEPDPQRRSRLLQFASISDASARGRQENPEPQTLGDGPKLPNVIPQEMRTEPLGQSNLIDRALRSFGEPSLDALQRGFEGKATPQEIARTFLETGPVGPLGSVMRDPLFHGTARHGLTELRPSERGPLGPGVYTSPSREIAGSYAGPEGTIHTLPERGRDVYHGHGHRTDEEWLGFKRDRQRLIGAADETDRPAIAELVDRMWSSDGYPLYQRIRQLLGSDEAAQALYRRAGFEGISGLVDGPEVVLFAPQQLRKP